MHKVVYDNPLLNSPQLGLLLQDSLRQQGKSGVAGLLGCGKTPSGPAPTSSVTEFVGDGLMAAQLLIENFPLIQYLGNQIVRPENGTAAVVSIDKSALFAAHVVVTHAYHMFISSAATTAAPVVASNVQFGSRLLVSYLVQQQYNSLIVQEAGPSKLQVFMICEASMVASMGINTLAAVVINMIIPGWTGMSPFSVSSLMLSAGAGGSHCLAVSQLIHEAATTQSPTYALLETTIRAITAVFVAMLMYKFSCNIPRAKSAGVGSWIQAIVFVLSMIGMTDFLVKVAVGILLPVFVVV